MHVLSHINIAKFTLYVYSSPIPEEDYVMTISGDVSASNGTLHIIHSNERATDANNSDLRKRSVVQRWRRQLSSNQLERNLRKTSISPRILNMLIIVLNLLNFWLLHGFSQFEGKLVDRD